MKYIDAEKLKAEINRRCRNYITTSKGDEYYIGQAKALDSLVEFIDFLQQEPQEEICSKCIHHGKDDDCYYPYGGMRRRINEDGVCECTGFYEKEQEQPDKETILRICKLHKVWSIMAPWENVEDFVMTNWNAENIV